MNEYKQDYQFASLLERLDLFSILAKLLLRICHIDMSLISKV